MQNGAISFIEKPVSANALTCLWRFLTSQGKGEVRCSAMEVPVEIISSPPAAAVPPGCPRGHGRTAAGSRGGGSEPGVAVKKKMVWTDPLHFKFLDAVNTLGIENAVPKNILKAMNVKGLTRENVASHLQKYRQFLRRNIQELQNGLLSGAGYQPRFAPKRVSRFAKLEQLFTHAQLEAASAAVSPSPSAGNTSCAAPPLSSHDESLFYRGWTRDPIAGNANSHYPSPETFFPNGSGEYESSSSCFGNFSVVPGNVEQSQNMAAAAGCYYDSVLPENDDLLSGVLNFIGESEDVGDGEGYSSTCSYSTPPQYLVPQFGESDMMQVSPQQDFPMDFPAAFGGWGENYVTYAAAQNPICEFSMQNMTDNNSGGYQFNLYYPNNYQQVGNEEALMMQKYNPEEGVGFDQWYDYSQWLTQPFLQRDNEDDAFVQSIFAANPYGVGAAANAQAFF
ncbi:unnamed protein product [Cuscuta campestris]|uniref:Myb-like domain-containing protein n=1 Tax=Cuscuta campestris TaxID=132261 RepID=A0A484LM33_9ASTE|nr:unnamed protein product [Cuscuta campestris]